MLLKNNDRRIIILAVLAFLLLVVSLGVMLNRLGVFLPFWKTEALRDIQPELGNAYIAPTRHPEISSHMHPSPAQVLEDGDPLPGPANALHDDIRTIGFGRYSFWHDMVYFSTSDNSDPRVNGRSYQIAYPVIIGDYFAVGVYFSLLMILLSMAYTFDLHQKSKLKFITWWPLAKRTIKDMALPASFAAVVPLWLLISFPPLFNYIDAGVYFSFNLRDNLPHYKPGYLVFIRSVNNLLVGNWLTLTRPSLVTDRALYFIVVVQHVITVLSIGYFSSVIFKTKTGQVLVSMMLGSLPVVSLYAHGIFQEALLSSLILILMGNSITIAKNANASNWNLLFIALSLYFLLLIRHETVILLALPILLLLCVQPVSQWRKLLCIRKLIVVVGLVAVSFQATMMLLDLRLGVIERPPIYGRLGVNTIVDGMSSIQADEKEKIIAKVISQLSDPIEKYAVKVLFNRTSYGWGFPYSKIRQKLQTTYPEMDHEQVMNKTDRTLNTIFWMYIKSCPILFLRTAIDRMEEHLSRTMVDDLDGVVSNSIMLYRIQQDGDRRYSVFSDLSLFKTPQTPARYRQLQESIWESMLRLFPNYGVIFLFVFIGAVAIEVIGFLEFNIRVVELRLVMVTLLFALGYLFVVSAAQPALGRYHNGSVILLFISLAVLLSRISMVVQKHMNTKSREF